MAHCLRQSGRVWLVFVALILWTFTALAAVSAPYAALVMDARTGEVLHSRNADTRLHPASLTKMMTLYIAFEAVENGELTMDTLVTISRKAAAEPPSKLGLKPGQKIALRYLVRAAAVKSANDAATAIAEAIEGSEAAFARRMNRTAKALGMSRTTFKNANGLTESGHLSTARDMTVLGRHLFYDYPQYYNIFSRTSTDAGVREVASTNRRFLSNYPGADGIKTGYTRAAGFNLVASAERGQERIIATVFGGRSSASRNAHMAELLDLGFDRAPSKVAVRKPTLPRYESEPDGAYGKTIRLVMAVEKSIRPAPRPGSSAPAAPAEDMLIALRDDIGQALAMIDLEEDGAEPLVAVDTETVAATVAEAIAEAETETVAEADEGPKIPAIAPRPRPANFMLAAATTEAEPEPAPVRTTDTGLEVVTRMSTSGGRHWGITVGRYGSRYLAERALLQTALLELGTLDEALRKVVQRPGGFDANFVGMSQEQADLACRRLQARKVDCAPFGPG